MSKIIICGEIDCEYNDIPINIFKMAVELSKQSDFQVETNNPQLVEALEVLCGEDNIDFYIFSDGEYVLQDNVASVYSYLGDIYDIINTIRFAIELDNEVTPKMINKEIEEYELKHQYYSEKKHAVVEENFKEYVEILPEPKHIQAYQTDKLAVFHNNFGSKVIARPGDWIIKDKDGQLYIRTTLSKSYEEVKEDE